MMSLKRRIAGLFGITVALAVCVHLVSIGKPKPVLFNSVREFKNATATEGLFYHTGTKQNHESYFYVADRPISFDVLQELQTTNKQSCGLTPAWRGIVWVTTIPVNIGGNVRTWGKLMVAGDEELMNHVERQWVNDSK
jgi:hypothetical protein